MISIRTEVMDIIESTASDVEVEPITPILDISFEKNEEFFLFGTVFDCNMIDKSLVDKPLQFELSIGNCGNMLDGSKESMKRSMDLNVEHLG